MNGKHLSIYLALAAIAGCSSSHDGEGVDGGATARRDGDVVVLPDGRVIDRRDGAVVVLPDGRVIDRRDGAALVLPDGRVIHPRDDGGGGGGGAHVGTPCETAEECPGLFCSPGGSGFGYCTWVCNDDRPCPDGAVCAFFDDPDIGYCMPRCARDSDCEEHFSCVPGVGDAPVCYPIGCLRDEDCEAGDLCGPSPSFGMQCYSPGSSVGDPCGSTDDCPSAGYCVDEESWGAPSGTCVTFCTLATGAECESGTTCVPWGFMSGAGSCVPTCDDENPCREGYGCTPTGEGRPNACVARCTDDSQCTEDRTCNFITGSCG